MGIKRTEADNRQVGGDHYKSDGEDHWTRVHRLGLSYFQGQITKYVERCWKKNGVQDLQKARHFLDKYIELNTPEQVVVAFQPTHRHAEGGLYRLRGPVQFHLWNHDKQVYTWVGAVLYENEKGEQFVRESRDFDVRMLPLDDGSEPGPSYVNQDGPNRGGYGHIGT